MQPLVAFHALRFTDQHERRLEEHLFFISICQAAVDSLGRQDHYSERTLNRLWVPGNLTCCRYGRAHQPGSSYVIVTRNVFMRDFACTSIIDPRSYWLWHLQQVCGSGSLRLLSESILRCGFCIVLPRAHRPHSGLSWTLTANDGSQMVDLDPANTKGASSVSRVIC